VGLGADLSKHVREVYFLRTSKYSQAEAAMRTFLVAAGFLLAFGGAANAQAAPKDDPWPFILTNVFDDKPIADGAGVIALDAPYRAEDAAIVPITIRSDLPAGSPIKIAKITLVIDGNPSPVAAVFTLGDAGTVTAISTRVRVDAYTNMRAVAETTDGKLYAAVKFVKASGGCSSPGLKNPDDIAHRGEMQFRRFDAPAGSAEAQIMIRHPNNSGLQRDPINNYYIPAFFVDDLVLKIANKPLLRVEGGISISENPSFRFTYSGAADGPVSVEAKDTDGHAYSGNWPAAGNAT
jgi:sulfur-oxidizing protein SoxY